MKRKKKLTLPSWLRSALHPSTLTVLKIKKEIFAPSRVLMAGFFLVILVGSLLLHLPAASTHGRLSYIDALFTATSAVCVTGLSVLDPGRDLTLLGQVILIMLIQLGGLGFMTFGTMLLIVLRKRITLSERLLISNSLNEDGLQGIVRLVMRIMGLTLSIEGIGAVLLMTRLIPKHGVARGVWYSIFHAISAFCNAGFDLAGGFETYRNDPIVMLIVMALITLGGIGFSVMFDVQKSQGRFSRLTLHSKLVLVISAILTVSGAVLFFLFEHDNPLTLADPMLHPGVRPVAALFQSVTTRTAGFQTIDQENLTPPSLMLTLIWMFIGASPASTGGGLKTTTFGIFFLLIVNVLRGRDRIIVFRRTINQSLVNRAVVLFTLALCLVILSFLALSLMLPPSEAVNSGNILYEVISAFATVGLTIGVTAELNFGGKLVMCAIMFIGRVGLMTIAFGLTRRHSKGQNHLVYPEGKVMIG